MSTPTATPRTDAECIQIYTEDVTGCADAVDYVCASFARTLETELARLRALFPAICSALGNGACCTPDVSIGFLESIPNEVASVVARLRADLERFTGHGLLDCHAICDQRDAAVARAERAEAMLAEWSVLNLWGGTPEIIHEFIKGQQNRIHHCQDLEAELAEAVDGEINGGSIPDTLLVIHVPRSPVGYRVGQPVKVILPAIDAAMKP